MNEAPLDDDSRRLLDTPGQVSLADLLVLSPADARIAARAGIFSPDPHRPVTVRDDTAVAAGAPPVAVRTYRPPGDDAALLPALLYLHGGGWLVGDLDTIDHLCRAIAHDAGCVVVSVDYRLAPEHPFPAAIEDARTALWWMVEQAPRLGIDPARVAVGGDSAGGNLAAALCLRTRDSGGPRIALQVLAYPVTDHRFDTPSYVENGEGFLLTRNVMMGFWERYLARPEDGNQPYASIVRADLTGLPPALVLTASHDPLRDEGEALARRLADAGVPVRCVRYNGTIHGFLVRFPIIAAGRTALAAITGELRQVLGRQEPRWPTRLVIEHAGPVVYPSGTAA